jgi:hypothetical protein
MAEWLLLVHQLPPGGASNPRVRIWRRLQDLGAVPLRSAVYVLPNSPQAHEDFSWVRREIAELKGQATLFAADAVDAADRAAIVNAFRAARAADYESLQRAIAAATKAANRHAKGAGQPGLVRGARALGKQLRDIEALDFFSAPGGDRAREALAQLEALMAGKRIATTERAAPVKRTEYTGRTWVTRRRPGVDRMSSAWLIRRFIDPRAKFAFAKRDDEAPARQVPFDMYTGEFGHHGGHCTFEVLIDRFGLDQPALRRIAEIVHDIDLKDRRYDSPETPTIAALVDGVRQAHGDDGVALERGIQIFEALFRSFETTEAGKRSSRRRGTGTSRTSRKR